MLEYAGSRSGLRTQRDEGAALVGVLRSLDWLLVAGIGGLIAVGLWAVAGVTRFDVAHNPSYYLNRQIGYAIVSSSRSRDSSPTAPAAEATGAPHCVSSASGFSP